MDWNFAGAFLAPQQQMNQMALQTVEMARGLQDIAASKAQMAQLAANTKLIGVETEAKQLSLDQQKRMAQLLAGLGKGDSPKVDADGRPIDPITQIAQAAFQSGDYELGSKLLGDDVRMKADQARTQEAQSNTQNNQMKFLHGLYVDVHDQASLDAANAWAVAHNLPAPLAGHQYSPKLITDYEDGLLAAEGKMTSKQRAAQEQANLAAKEAAIRWRSAEIVHLGQVDERANAKAKAKAKAGGKLVSAPTKQESLQAQSLISSKYKYLGGAELQQAGYAIASRAQAIRRANPGIDMDTALRQAFREADADGDFSEKDSLLSTVDHFTKKDSAAGLSRENPLPLPDNPSPKTMKPGRWYTLPDGQVKQWSGK